MDDEEGGFIPFGSNSGAWMGDLYYGCKNFTRFEFGSKFNDQFLVKKRISKDTNYFLENEVGKKKRMEPIDVKMRPDRIGLQYQNFQERTEQSLRDFDEDLDMGEGDSEEEQNAVVDVDLEFREPSWQKGTKRKKKNKIVINVPD